MSSSIASPSPPETTNYVSRYRIFIQHDPLARGIIPSLLAGVWLLAFLGMRYPLQMLPLLLFELAWKLTWLVAFGLPQWLTHQMPATHAEDMKAILMGVILMPIVIPWRYVYQHYVRRPGDPWR